MHSDQNPIRDAATMVEMEGKISEIFLEFTGADEVEVPDMRFLAKLRGNFETLRIFA